MMHRVAALLAALVAAVALVDTAAARPEIPRRTWQENITMRDGVELHTRFVAPHDFEEQVADGTTFIPLVDRSPYGYTDLEWIPDIFLGADMFVTVGQDMRGTGYSGGKFSLWHSDTNDSLDTYNWLQEQDWATKGTLYAFGASADGLGALQHLWNDPEYVGAQYLIWCTPQAYFSLYPGGTYRESLIVPWISGTVRPDEVDDDLYEIAYNEFPENEWWRFLNFTGNYDMIDVPTGFWAGWYDIFQSGMIGAYENFELESKVLFVDPLGHCQSAADYFAQNTVEGRSLVPIAQAMHVYGMRDMTREFGDVTWYVMSSSDDVANYWTTADNFPAFDTVSYFLHGDGTLSKQAPTDDDGTADSTTYTFDPADPAPSSGGNNLNIPCGPLQQNDIEARDDVLTFTTAVLEDDLVLTGPMNAILYVSSDAVDTDFHVKITDVLPSGESRLLMDNSIRMRWREMHADPVMMEDGVVYEVTISLWNTSYIFPAGNQMRVDVSSASYPRFSVNPNNGRLLVDEDYTQNVTAHNTLFHTAGYQSRVELPVVAREDLPEIDVLKAFSNLFPEVKDVGAVIESMSESIEKMAEHHRHPMTSAHPYRGRN